MLKFLLDEHISPDVADGLRRRNRSLVIHCMAEWENGGFLGQEDSACLLEAAEQRLTLVTYDRRTIPPLLKIWAEEGLEHGGVIFVDEKTISPADRWPRTGLGPGVQRNREMGLDWPSLLLTASPLIVPSTVHEAVAIAPKSCVFSNSLEKGIPIWKGTNFRRSCRSPAGRRLLQQYDCGEPLDLVDPKSGVDYFTAATELSKA